MKHPKGKHNNVDVAILFVSKCLTWALISEDLVSFNKKRKVDVLELSDYDQFELEELSQKYT